MSVNPATAQTYTYQFSSCSAGVSLTLVFPIQIAMGPTMGGNGMRTYSYDSFSATATLSMNGSSQTATGILEASITYIAASPPYVQAQTGLDFGFSSSGINYAAWSVLLAGYGDLLPNGLTQNLPPVSVWNVPPNAINAIVVNGQYYTVDAYDSCGAAAGPAIDILKTLGLACDEPGCATCGEPINLGTGNVFESVTDYQTAGSNKLAFSRYYNSMATSNTYAVELGANWRSNYDRYLRLSDSQVFAERPDGQQVTFTLTNGAWTADTDNDYTLSNSGSTWTLTDPDDSIETYNAISSSEGLLQSIRARNGYTQTLAYDASNTLTTVTDSFNLQLSFDYANGLLSTVTTPDGLILTYGYAGSLLTSVSYSTTPVTSQTYLYENTALPSALTGIIDENGNRYVTWTYDSMGRGLTSQFAGGAGLTTIAYNDTDGSRTVTNALGEQTVYKFTTLQNTPKVTEVDQAATADSPAGVIQYTYDSNGYTASQTDPNGNVTNYVNDSHGQPTSTVEAAGTPQSRTTTVTYHPTFHLPLQVVRPGLTTTLTYDSNGELLTKTLADTTVTTVPYATGGQTRTWTYTWSNFLLASIHKPGQPANTVTTFSYDSSGALTGTTNALGQTTQVTQHLPGGLPQTVIDPNGVTMQFTYDPRLRLLSRTIQSAAGPLVTSYTYDAAGNRTSATLPDGSSMTSAYDAAHRLTGVTDLFNQSASTVLDGLGDRTQATLLDSSGNPQRTRSTTYDALGRVRQDVRGAGQTTTFTYDANGNSITTTDPLMRVTTALFDPLNRPTKITDANQGVTTTAYDAFDRPTSITDPNGAVTTFVYDGFGELIQAVSPDSGTTVFRYDSDGNLVQTVDGTGAVANHTYDTLGRMLSSTYPADAAENVAYTYDEPSSSFGVGRLTSVTDAAGSLTRSYDERGNLLTETRVIGSATLTTVYTYDGASQLLSIAYPSGWTVTYTRDMMGRTTAINAQSPGGDSAMPVLSAIGYQPFGPVNAMTFGNNVAETRAFDQDYRVTALTDTGSSPLQNLAYSYDAADNVTAIVNGVTSASSQSFAYDVLNRLISANGAYGGYTYTYDAAGNRLTMSLAGSSTSYSYTLHSNQLDSVSSGGASQAVAYMNAGGISSFNPAVGPVTSLTYNQAGRIAAAMAGSNVVAQYTYDGFNQRLIKAGASTTLYQYNQNHRLLEESDDQGNPIVDYIYLDSLPVATISPGVGEIYFLHDDRLGTPQAATDSGQNVVWIASYGPFGEMTTTPSLIVQNLRMPGQEFDSDTGLYHNGFRDYAPSWGRYLQSDPLGLEGGLNTYTYAQANPVKLTDPLGLLSLQDVEDAVSSWSKDIASDIQVNRADIEAEGFRPWFNSLPCVQKVKDLWKNYGGPIMDVYDFFTELAKALAFEFEGLVWAMQKLWSTVPWQQLESGEVPCTTLHTCAPPPDSAAPPPAAPNK